MVVSSRFGATCAIGENAARNALELIEACDRLKTIPAKVNETGTVTSERVHVGEIAVIFAVNWRIGRSAHPA
jgi:hypothetical protein